MVHAPDELEPVGTTGLRSLGVGGVESDDLEQSRIVHPYRLPSTAALYGHRPRGQHGGMTDPLTDPLLAARALVLADLQSCALADAETVSVLEESVAQRRWWVGQWPEGVEFVAGLVAQDVQDGILDRLGRWPVCRTCNDPDGHGLYIEPELGPDPHWVCEKSATVVAPLGRL